jgi:hypothetical protein
MLVDPPLPHSLLVLNPASVVSLVYGTLALLTRIQPLSYARPVFGVLVVELLDFCRISPVPDPASLQAVLDGFTTGPAVMFGPAFDVLGYNRIWNLIYAIDSYGGPFSRNHVYRLFIMWCGAPPQARLAGCDCLAWP